MKLTDTQGSLLRSLALFRSKGLTEKEELVDLEVLVAEGFAIKAGTNGSGLLVAVVTKLGVLKALAAGLIPTHPDNPMPAGDLLAVVRREM